MKENSRLILIAAILQLSPMIVAAQQLLPPPPPPPPAQNSTSSGPAARADSLLQAGNVVSAIKEYENLFPGCLDDRSILYNYACALSLAGRADSSFKYLYMAVKDEPSIDVLTNPHLAHLRDTKGWTFFEDGLISEYNERNNNSIKDVAYAKSLLRLLCMDQSGFYEMGIAVRALGPGSPVVAAIRRLQSLQNEKNLEELQALINAKGWPEKSQVGSQAASASFFVVQHSNAMVQEKYVGLFEAACRKGEGNWQQYALMFDRMRMNQHKPQRFGTHAYLNPAEGNPDELYPLEDYTRVDEWRKEIGLEPLEEYLQRTNIKYHGRGNRL